MHFSKKSLVPFFSVLALGSLTPDFSFEKNADSLAENHAPDPQNKMAVLCVDAAGKIVFDAQVFADFTSEIVQISSDGQLFLLSTSGQVFFIKDDVQCVTGKFANSFDVK
jgi:hypothetical protein